MSSTTSPFTTSNTPFFPDPSTLTPPPQNTDTSENNDLAKMVLEWLFLVIALVLAAAIITYRFHRLRQMNRPPTHFFRRSRPSESSEGGIRSIPRTTGLPQFHSAAAVHPYYLSAPATTYFQAHSRRTNAADIDSDGRRLGGGGDHDDDNDKDILPPYDHAGGPPKYVDLELQDGRTTFRGLGMIHHNLQQVPAPVPATAHETTQSTQPENAQQHDAANQAETPPAAEVPLEVTTMQPTPICAPTGVPPSPTP